MNSVNPQDFSLLFPVFFVGLWFSVTVALGFMSGWYRLMEHYPDRSETPLLTLKNRSGSLGLVSLNRILNLSVCPSGLRIGMMRIFGPFCRDFFVPWEAIAVQRRDRYLWQTAVLELGPYGLGRLRLSAEVADRLARAATTHWPEPGPFPVESDADSRSRLFRQWLAATTVASAFFLLAPRLMAPRTAGPPALVAILFPAIVFGIGSVVRYLRRNRP